MLVRGRSLRFGIQLQAQRTSWADFARGLATVEELGFDTIWTFDHLLPPSGADDGPALETLTTLAAMATLTSRARIGVLVNGVLYRDPATLAKSSALVDEISGGRLEFSLGAAWAEREFKAYGFDYPPLRERYARLDETLQIVKLLWTQDRSDFHGDYYRLENAPCAPKPVQAPYPPIMVGGAGLGSLRIAAKHADAWNVMGPPSKVAEKAAVLKELCADIGRSFDDIELSWHGSLAIAATREQAVDIAREAQAAQGQTFDGKGEGWLIGTPDDVVEQLRAYTAVGISHWIIGIPHPFDAGPLSLFQEEVAPAARQE
jgi:F420-dependent oxidoreductase-like protein